MFNYIAPHYDGANRILSLGLDHKWRSQAVKWLDVCADHLYLDVGCGTGDISFEILRQNPKAQIIGIDSSLGMLEVGWKKMRRYGLESQVSFREGDCLGLKFPDDRFDGAISVFCILLAKKITTCIIAHRPIRFACRVATKKLRDFAATKVSIN